MEKKLSKESTYIILFFQGKAISCKKSLWVKMTKACNFFIFHFKIYFLSGFQNLIEVQKTYCNFTAKSPSMLAAGNEIERYQISIHSEWYLYLVLVSYYHPAHIYLHVLVEFPYLGQYIHISEILYKDIPTFLFR